ncbi:sensor domain-containing diguanylate cyclase [candidate division WOR-3 bacterium]|nr:sensor domain-containing diguanylate cyclase [candidate division WOR-3 bacterium]MCK4528056.1 sensor domain-containing diguanylate cyclase [candidate division WOR-3 bacterium]
MKKHFLNIYEIIVILTGIGITLFLLVSTKPVFPPFYQYAIYFIVALVSSYLYIDNPKTIISFEIVIFYFFFLMFSPLIASLTAVLGVLLLRTFKTLLELKTKGKSFFSHEMKMGLYNAGVYGLIYLVSGKMCIRLSHDIRMIVGILVIVCLNEIFFSIHTLLSGENFFEYLKNEGLSSDLIELAVYPFGIAMYLLYRYNGFLPTVPIIVGIILLSYIGKRMSDYQEQLSSRLMIIKKLNEISQSFSKVLDIQILIKTILEETHKMLKPKLSVLYITNNYDKSVHIYCYDGQKMEEIAPDKLKEYKGFYQIPLEGNDKEIGFIGIDVDRVFEKDELVIAENIAKQATICLDNAMLYKISIEDSLTGLYTRRHFESRLSEEISRADRTNQSFSLVMFDIDDFKRINDNYGHKAGDEVLMKFTQTMESFTRPFDISARWGGDEFILILPRTDEKQAREIGKRVVAKFAGMIRVNSKKIRVKSSFGVAMYKSNSGIPADEVFHIADHNLIEAKKSIRKRNNQ